MPIALSLSTIHLGVHRQHLWHNKGEPECGSPVMPAKRGVVFPVSLFQYNKA